MDSFFFLAGFQCVVKAKFEKWWCRRAILSLVRDGGKQPPPLCLTGVRVGCFRVLQYHTWDFSISHEADPPHNVKLRQAGSGVRRLWDVELVIEEGHMYLCRGWEKFYSAYDLRTGYFLLFRYDDDATMLIVKVFNTTMCRMRYTDDEDASNGSSSSDTGYSQSSSDYGCSKSNIDSGFSESSSDSGSSKDSKKDDPDWSGGEEEQSGPLQDDDGHQAEET
ncbi:uncharacterized protein [Aegilops tauschii subsp. strangulata]|uniref:uncharacterized protein isoform X1 n=1 Tax=Aegilops tauschii subsp. strangulata TaxID=200361 RepID=UPI003CC8C3DF